MKIQKKKRNCKKNSKKLSSKKNTKKKSIKKQICLWFLISVARMPLKMTYAQVLKTAPGSLETSSRGSPVERSIDETFEKEAEEILKIRRRDSETLEAWKYRLKSQLGGAREATRRACNLYEEDFHLCREECKHDCSSDDCFDGKCPCQERCRNHAHDSALHEDLRTAEREEQELEDQYKALQRFACGWFFSSDVRVLRDCGIIRSAEDADTIIRFVKRWSFPFPRNPESLREHRLLEPGTLASVFLTGRVDVCFPSTAFDDEKREGTAQLVLEVDTLRDLSSDSRFVSFRALVRKNPWFGQMFANETVFCHKMMTLTSQENDFFGDLA